MLVPAEQSNVTVIILATIAAVVSIVNAFIARSNNKIVSATKTVAETTERNSNSRLTELFLKVENLTTSLERSKGETIAANLRAYTAEAVGTPTPPPGEAQ